MAKKPNDLNSIDNEIKQSTELSSLIVKGTDNRLSQESDNLVSLVKTVTSKVSDRFGKSVNGSFINYWNEVSVRDLYDKAVVPSGGKGKYKTYDDFMKGDGMTAVQSLFEQNATFNKKVENFRGIRNYIPECAKALEIIKTNIISPDDFTKKIFNIEYDDIGIGEDKVKEDSAILVEKYGLEDLTDEIIADTLTDSKAIYSVQSLDDEFVKIINDIHDTGILTEAIRYNDPRRKDVILRKDNIELNESAVNLFKKHTKINEKSKIKELNEDIIQSYVADFVNRNVIIGSPKELLRETVEIRNALKEDMNNPFVDTFKEKRGRGRPKKKLEKIGLNGSVIQKLPIERIVEVKKNHVIYGYYLLETIEADADYTSTYDKLNKISPPGSLNFINQIDVNMSKMQTGNGVDDLNDIFVKAISDKLDAKFLRNNKDFVWQIYDILKDAEFGNKNKLKVTFFDTKEICVWEHPSIYKDIEFFAKLYLTVLTNDILLALGRSHDKRIFYVNVGEDKASEQAVQNIIRDIKTKEFKLDDVADFTSIMQLNPGIFHDYFMPVLNGERPIEIDTLQGMNQSMNNEFLDWLKNTITNSFIVPQVNISEEQVEIARTVSSQNGMFARAISVMQKKFAIGFEKMLKILYRNEFRYVADGEENAELEYVKIDRIKVSFPSPLTLTMTNLIDTFTNAIQLADFVSDTIVITDGSDEDVELTKTVMKSEVIMDYVQNINWEKYINMLDDNVGVKAMKLKIKKQRKEPEENDALNDIDPYSGY